MMFALTCALCATQPAFPAGGLVDQWHIQLLDERLSLRDVDASQLPPPPVLTLALGRFPYEGAGGGDDHSNSDHMGPMWIVMGVVMVVMMVGMGVYVMRNGAPVGQLQAAALPSPVQLAVPVTDLRGGGG